MLVFVRNARRLFATHDPAMICNDKQVEIAVRQHGIDVTRLATRPKVLDHLIGIKHIAEIGRAHV